MMTPTEPPHAADVSWRSTDPQLPSRDNEALNRVARGRLRDALQALMKESRLTQRDVAAATGVSEPAVSQWLARDGRKRMSLESLIRIRALFAEDTRVSEACFAEFDRAIEVGYPDVASQFRRRAGVALASTMASMSLSAVEGLNPYVAIAEDIADSYETALGVFESLSHAQPFSTPSNSAGCKSNLAVLASRSDTELCEMFKSHRDQWELIVLAPYLVMSASDLHSRRRCVRAYAKAFFACPGERCTLAKKIEPDSHLPAAFSFMLMARAATTAGVSRELVESFIDASADTKGYCKPHLFLIALLVLDLSDDPESWPVAGPLLKEIALSIGLDNVDATSLPLTPQARADVLERVAHIYRSDALKDLAGRCRTLLDPDLERSIGVDLDQVIDKFGQLHKHEQVVASLLLREVAATCGVVFIRKALKAALGQNVLACLVLLEGAAELGELNSFADEIRGLRDAGGRNAELSLLARRWMSPSMRAAVHRSAPSLAGPVAMLEYEILRSADVLPEHVRVWSAGKLLFDNS